MSFSEDKPKDCRYCYFWKNKKVGCELGKENCYYRMTMNKKVNECIGCPYGRADPCIGWCTKKIMDEIRMHRL